LVTVEDADLTPHFDTGHDALLLDIDGTLLDIAPVPEAVTVPPGLAENIERLFEATSGAVAFVSGRTLETVDRFFAPLRLPAIGCHGAEFRASRGGDVERAALLADALKQRIVEIANVAPGIRFEDKSYTFAIHFRQAPEVGPRVLRALLEQRSSLLGSDLQILGGKSVIEIKPRWFNKGTGMSRLMRHRPFSGRRPVFLGDDTTDEDVFRVLPEFGGRGYAVGREIAGADFAFESPGEVRKWLAALASRTLKREAP
jgi:trehalose 6-phosphate phosphatase